MVFFQADPKENLLGKRHFESKIWLSKTVLGLLFLVVLSIFLHFREVSVEVLELILEPKSMLLLK